MLQRRRAGGVRRAFGGDLIATAAAVCRGRSAITNAALGFVDSLSPSLPGMQRMFPKSTGQSALYQNPSTCLRVYSAGTTAPLYSKRSPLDNCQNLGHCIMRDRGCQALLPDTTTRNRLDIPVICGKAPL